MTQEKRIAAVITAAGMSTRMKAFKQTLPIGEKTFAEHVVDRFVRAGADPVVVVLGHRAQEVREALTGYPVTFLENPDYATTQMFDTVKIGLDYVKDCCDRVFVTPVDVPLFSVKTLCAELETEAPVVIPVSDGVKGHPILLDADILLRILAFTGEGGLKGAVDASQAECVNVSVEDEGSTQDADTQEEYRQLREYYERMQN